MYQQQMPQPRDERGWNSPEVGSIGDPQQVNQLADAIARQLQAQAPSTVQMSPFHQAQVSAGQRLALAIVSVVMLVGLAGICLGILGTVGLIALGIGGVIILGINVLYNGHR